MIIIKQNNVFDVVATTDESLGGNDIYAGIRDSSGVITEFVTTVLSDTSYNIRFDTTNLAAGNAFFDTKIGNVSSNTIPIFIDRKIS